MKTFIFDRRVAAALFVAAVAVAMTLGFVPSGVDAASAAAGLGALAAAPFFALETGGVDFAELKRIIEEQGRAWEEFKSEHARQIEELKKGRKDPLLEEKLEKLSARIDDLQAQKDEIEKKLNRPQFTDTDEARAEAKALRQFNLELKAVAIVNGRPQPADVSLEEFRAYKSAFVKFLRTGGEPLTVDERKAMQVGLDSEGGYLVPADMSGRIVQRLFELSPIRQIANVQVIGSDRLEGIEDIDEAAAGWVGETTQRTDTATPKVGKYEIPAHEMYAQPKATQKLLDDSVFDVETWLQNKVADKFARLEGAAFVAGDGVAKPRGFTTYPTAAQPDSARAWGTFEHVNTGANGDFNNTNPADVLFDVEGAFKAGYLAGAVWVTRRSVITKVRKFKGQDNNYLWQPGLAAGRPATLIGYPIVLAEDMPALASGSLSMALGNFQIGYQIVDRLGIRVLRDPYTDKPYVKFYTTKRTGGAAVNFEAIKFVRFGS